MLSASSLTELVEGEPINGYDSALWVERYQEPGEFKIEAKLSSGLKEFLPIGTFISHIRTRELMMVENHIIEEPKDEDPTIEISGRSLVAYLSHRIIGQNWAELNNDIPPYVIPANDTWEQIAFMIQDHIGDGSTFDTDDELPNVLVNHSCTGTGTVEERLVRYGDVLTRTLEVLKVDDVGLKILRPTPTDANIYFHIYQGVNRTAQVRFSTILGELDNVQYLFSNKRVKTAARVMGRWVQVIVEDPSFVNLARRYMLVDASDLDQQFAAMPTSTDLANMIAAMTVRGQEALANQLDVTITQADISPNARLQYGVDYNLGDLVIVDGNFNESQVMRVSEFAEIEDENGTSGQPTLQVPGED